MFDEDQEGYYDNSDDDADDYEYYVSYIRALENEGVERSIIVQELMSEFELELQQAVKVLKKYYAEKSSYDDEEDDDDDYVDDDDYGDGNSER